MIRYKRSVGKQTSGENWLLWQLHVYTMSNNLMLEIRVPICCQLNPFDDTKTISSNAELF